jgi:hypothetical protein
VVRESEMTVAQAVATLPESLRARIQSTFMSTGRLPPDVRALIMQEAHSRVNAYKGMFDQDMGQYRGIVERGKYNPADVIPDFGQFQPYAPKTQGKSDDPKALPPGVTVTRRGTLPDGRRVFKTSDGALRDEQGRKIQ